MDYRDFTKREDAYNGFVQYRKEVMDSINKGGFNDAFTELCTKALAGDCVAQDCVAYFFNKGVPDFLASNYDYYMSWQILAGANGNEFSLEKMEFFLNPALEIITNEPDILTMAMQRKNMPKDNALMVISNLLCEGIVDELGINPRNLIELQKKPQPYSPQKNRVYVDAMERSILNVARFLVS